MKKVTIIIFLVLTMSSCYKTISIDGFDKEKWVNNLTACSSYRNDISTLLLDNEGVILKSTQNEVESLLGKASEHELYERNQKFFHYRLSPPDSCGQEETLKYLSIRFNAMGRANQVQVMLREANK
ncbi:hypothetical protein SAMN05421640_1161 [Ekhidna lutea]|uniref:Lipoprotein n=1 Tax=Ekhidna lutea TaxID=447679 RepID=A0A239H611_EKHLU|nr:hypothetical protein [Ekhidna lutea]SNS76876.1 hypothetical protein SAMN05421640_1161 [Ekhidna lutea]